MAPHPSPDDLAAFDAGRLRPTDREVVERHVAGCPDCCRVLEQLPEDDLAALMRTSAAGATAPEVPENLAVPPELVGHPRYEVLGVVGVGGMGVVYRAHQRHLDRVVAVKLLHRRLTDRPGFADRFAAEVRALARLNHPNVAAAHDADRAGELHFLVMEYVEGESLEAVVRRRGPLGAAEACGLVRQAALGLQHAFEQGLVHRDVKPANLLLTPGGVVKVVDFGLARVVRGAEPAGGSDPPVLGTPEYMAPEQARDPAAADVRSDLYSLGCTLYFLLAGRPPFARPTPLQTLMAHQNEPPPIRGRRPDAPPAVAAVLDRLLAKDPADRFATPQDAADALARAAESVSPAPRSGKRVWALLAAGAALLAAVGVLAALPRDRPHRPQPTEEPPEPTPAAVAEAPAPRLIAGADGIATPERVAALRRAAGDRLVGWVREHNVWGPEHVLVGRAARGVEQGLPKNAGGFAVRLGGQLLKSGRPTLVVAGPGGFHEFELTPEQAAALRLGERSSVFTTLGRIDESRRVRPEVELSDLRIDGADGLAADQPLMGTVGYHFRSPPRPGGHLRLTYYLPGGNYRVALSHYPKSPLAERGQLAFRFGPRDARPFRDEPVFVLFAEWVTRDGPAVVVDSDTAAALIRFKIGGG